MQDDVIEFLKHSNWIENVTDQRSLDQAVIAWKYLIEEPKLTEHVIRRTHKILMLHHLVGIYKGYYRRVNVEARRGGIVIKKYPNWETVENMMEGWITQIKVPPMAYKFDPENRPKFLATWIKKCHIDYEEIHPFVDGNGRTGRMFMNWQRVKLGLPIEVIRLEDREEYYRWFKG